MPSEPSPEKLEEIKEVSKLQAENQVYSQHFEKSDEEIDQSVRDAHDDD
jgi:hypothetical protein